MRRMTSSIRKERLVSKAELNEMSPLGREIAEGLVNAIRHTRGQKAPARVTVLRAPDPPPAFSPKKVLGLRRRFGMTQMQFARLINVSVKSVEGWEQGKRKPGGPTRRLLQLFENESVVSIIAGNPGAEGIRQFTSSR